MHLRELIIILSGAAAALLLATYVQSTQPAQSTSSSLPKIEMVRVKRTDPGAPKPGFQLGEGEVDLMKVFSLGSSEGIGATWKVPIVDTTFHDRYGRW